MPEQSLVTDPAQMIAMVRDDMCLAFGEAFRAGNHDHALRAVCAIAEIDSGDLVGAADTLAALRDDIAAHNPSTGEAAEGDDGFEFEIEFEPDVDIEQALNNVFQTVLANAADR